QKGLWPAADSPARAEALSWVAWSTVTLGGDVFHYLRNTSDRFAADQKNAAQAEAAKKALDGHLKLLEDRLDGRDYLSGKTLTLVDLANANYVGFMTRLGLPLDGFPHVAAWVGRCVSRPAMGVALAG